MKIPPQHFNNLPSLVTDWQRVDVRYTGRIGTDHKALIREVVDRTGRGANRDRGDRVAARGSASGPDECVSALRTSREDGINQVR